MHVVGTLGCNYDSSNLCIGLGPGTLVFLWLRAKDLQCSLFFCVQTCLRVSGVCSSWHQLTCVNSVIKLSVHCGYVTGNIIHRSLHFKTVESGWFYNLHFWVIHSVILLCRGWMNEFIEWACRGHVATSNFIKFGDGVLMHFVVLISINISV